MLTKNCSQRKEDNMENNLNTVEVSYKNELFLVTNHMNGVQIQLKPFTVHERGYKYFLEFCAYFKQSVNADSDASVLLTNEATEAVNSIMEFNRLVF